MKIPLPMSHMYNLKVNFQNSIKALVSKCYSHGQGMPSETFLQTIYTMPFIMFLWKIELEHLAMEQFM